MPATIVESFLLKELLHPMKSENKILFHLQTGFLVAYVLNINTLIKKSVSNY